MDAELLAKFAGVGLMVVFAYVPGVKARYDELAPDYKRVVVLVCLLAVAVGVYVASCLNVAGYVTCDEAGAVALGKVFLSALVANQAAFLIAPGK